MRIYKYQIPIADNFKINMPADAEILSFQSQYDELNIWAAVEPTNMMEERKFSVVGTGHEIDMDLVKKFIGTAQIMGGRFVWHLFELK